MGLPTLAPILDSDLPEFCDFLHQHLSRRIDPRVWADAFRQSWDVDKPNNGFLIRDDEGRIVGGIGAIYAQRIIRGRPEQFCNITSWVVTETYRSQSMRLAMAVVSQPGYHFTDLTPTQVVAGSLQFLKFKPLDAGMTVIPNLPWPWGMPGASRVMTAVDRIEGVLPPDAVKVLRDHRRFPWLCHAAIGRRGRYCHVIYKAGRLKGLPSAFVLALSDPDVFLRHHRALGGYLLIRHGMATTRVETRLLSGRPALSVQLRGYRSKMFRSDTLNASDISNLYSELVALDL